MTHSSRHRHWSRLPNWLAIVLLFLLVAQAAMVVPAGAQNLDSRVLPQLLKEAAERPGDTFRVIVTRIDNNRGADNALAAQGGRKLKEVGNVGFAANVPGRAIEALGRNRAVKFVSYDAPMRKTGTVDYSRLTTLYPEAAQATKVWLGDKFTSPYTGTGVGVAVLDTGISQTFGAGTLRGDWKAADGSNRILAQVKYSSNTNNMSDSHGHGTAVAGVLAGNSWYHKTRSLQGKYIGIAPEANLVNVKVSDDQGMSYVSDVVNAIEWVIANRVTYNIRVMNLSLVSSVAESYKTSVLAGAAERAWFNGIFVVVAAGNSGADTLKYAPANDPFVVTVGAADLIETADKSDDNVAPWSSYGLTQDGFSKPEIVAPGRRMVTTLASTTSVMAKALPAQIVSTEYIRISGTSFAAPVVAGIAALAFQAHPEWTNDQLKWLLTNTATVLGSGYWETVTRADGSTSQVWVVTNPYPGQGAGTASANKVVTYKSVPLFANQGLAISDWLVTTDGTTNYSSANWSSANWSSANWSSANWSSANWSSANWSTATFQSLPEGMVD